MQAQTFIKTVENQKKYLYILGTLRKTQVLQNDDVPPMVSPPETLRKTHPTKWVLGEYVLMQIGPRGPNLHPQGIPGEHWSRHHFPGTSGSKSQA